ncbi:MAG: PP2C family protein-serine/threonine phosphatase [Desulfobacterales bacterium]
MTIDDGCDGNTGLSEDQVACKAQVRLLEGFLAKARTSREMGALKAAMQNTLDIVVDLTDAGGGSLFLFDEAGSVKECLLARTTASEEEILGLVDRVLDAGLAGWVRTRLRAGLVQDTVKDRRWLVMENDPFPVRSALCVPVLREKSLFGIITLMHSEPLHFKAENLKLIQTTADQMALVLENIRLYEQLNTACRAAEIARQEAEAYSAALDRQLELGRRIQQDFLPGEHIEIPGWDTIAWFAPAYQVSGDFYDVFRLRDGLFGFVVGDVCDKGIGAALYMGLFRSLIRVFSERIGMDDFDGTGPGTMFLKQGRMPDTEVMNPLRAVSLTNRYIVDNHGRTGMFATLFFGVVDAGTGVLSYINAGHENAYVVGPGAVKQVLNVTGPAVGLAMDSRFQVRSLRMEAGDILLGHTDGVTEACSPGGDFFGKSRLRRLLDNGAASAEALTHEIRRELLAFIGHDRPSDDATVLCIQRLRLPDPSDGDDF